MGAQGSSLLNEIQRENSLDPVAGQNSGFNPDRPDQFRHHRQHGGRHQQYHAPPPVAPKPVVPNPVSDSANSRHCRSQARGALHCLLHSRGVAHGGPHGGGQPYDRTKKIKILNRGTNKPYPSGTVLRDTNFPNEIKKFRVP